MVFIGVQVSDVYETQDKKIFCVRAWFYKFHEEQGGMIENQFDIVNVNDWAWCYAFKHNDEISHCKCRAKYWSEIKEMEDQSVVYFYKWSELKNKINDLDDIWFHKDIIVNFVNKGSLSNDDNIEDPEDPFEVTQYLKERSGNESNLEEIYMKQLVQSLLMIFFEKRLKDLILK